MSTTQFWIGTLLANLSAPQNGVNTLACTLWAQSEGLPLWYHNWFATFEYVTGWQPARTGFSPPYYPKKIDGITATVDTLKQANMATITNALRAGAPLPTIFEAINRSPWCLGCQTGHYPIALYEAIQSGAGAIQTTGAPPPRPATVGLTGTQAGAVLYDLFATLDNWVEVITDEIYTTMQYIQAAAPQLMN